MSAAKILVWENGQKVIRDALPGELVESTYEERLAAWRAGREVSRLEMSFALETAGVLSAAEADQFVAFGLPQPLLDLIATLPESDQALARRKMLGATVFPRADPLWDALTASEGWPDDADIDAIFGWEG